MGDPERPRLGHFDFSEALSLTPEGRLARCVREMAARHARSGNADLCDMPPVPVVGATEEELTALEQELGVPLPAEYRAFLSRWRYLGVGPGLAVWGLDHEGLSTGRPCLSTDHPVPGRFLVFGECWRFADGDQLLFPLDVSSHPVVLYLHEERPPRAEPFAPSFSLAVWRLVFEDAEGA